METLHISLKAEELLNIYGFGVTNSNLATAVVVLVIVLLAFLYRLNVAPVNYLVHGLISSLYKFSETIVGEKYAQQFFPLFATLFVFIILMNWFGLIPGLTGVYVANALGEKVHLFRGPTADLNTTIALALVSVFMVQYYGLRSLGLKVHLSKYFDFRSPIQFFVGILELISEFTRILSFSFRLFGNIFAGEVLLLVIGFLVPLLATTPFIALEIFVGFIQAFVFSMLTLVFVSNATAHS